MASTREPLLAKAAFADPAPAVYGTAPDAPVMDRRSVHVDAVDTESSCLFCTTPLATCLGALCLPLTLLGMPATIPPRHEAVGTVFGRYVGTWRTAGLVFINPCGLRLHYVSINNRCNELSAIKVADGSGNSLVVSGIITYRVVDSARAALDMEHLEAYVKVQAHAVLKRVASRFPYVTYDGSPSLITEQAALSSQLAALLQDKVAVAGVHVIAYELSDLAYAKEIAPQMLVRQQAQAIIDARKTIVTGAVGIVADAMEGLKERGMEVAEGADKNRIVGNLLVVLCGEQKPVPTFDM